MTTEIVETKKTFRDCYEVLRVDRGAQAEAVDQAYWHLARVYNSAILSDPDAKQDLDELNEAYCVLRSPELRREYDQVRDGDMNGWPAPVRAEPEPPREPKLQSAPQPNPSPPAAMTEQRPKLSISSRSVQSAAPRQLSLPQLDFSSWRTIAVAFVILVMTSVALVTGTEAALVLAILLGAIGAAAYVVVAALARQEGWSLPALDFLGMSQPPLPLGQSIGPASAVRSRPAHDRRSSPRPDNLQGVLVPGGASQAVRRLVYQMYNQWRHLSPADVHAVARYAALTERFTKGERRLRKAERSAQTLSVQSLAAEQRALASELRQHEVTLGITAASRTSAQTAGRQL